MKNFKEIEKELQKIEAVTTSLKIYKENLYKGISKYLFEDNGKYISYKTVFIEIDKSLLNKSYKQKNKKLYKECHKYIQEKEGVKSYYYLLYPKKSLKQENDQKENYELNFFYISDKKDNNNFNIDNFKNIKNSNRIIINMFLSNLFFNSYNKIWEKDNFNENYYFHIKKSKKGNIYDIYEMLYKIIKEEKNFIIINISLIKQLFLINEKEEGSIEIDNNSFNIKGIKFPNKRRKLDARSSKDIFLNFGNGIDRKGKIKSEDKYQEDISNLKNTKFYFYHMIFQTIQNKLTEFNIENERILYKPNKQFTIKDYSDYRTLKSNLILVNNTKEDFNEEIIDILYNEIKKELNCDLSFYNKGKSINNKFIKEKDNNYLFFSDNIKIEFLNNKNVKEEINLNEDEKIKLLNSNYKTIDIYSKLKYENKLYKNINNSFQNFNILEFGNKGNIIKKELKDKFIEKGSKSSNYEIKLTSKFKKTLLEVSIKDKIKNKKDILTNVKIENTFFTTALIIDKEVFEKNVFLVNYEIKSGSINIIDYSFTDKEDLDYDLNISKEHKINKGSFLIFNENKEYIYISKDNKSIVGNKKYMNYTFEELFKINNKRKDINLVPFYTGYAQSTLKNIYFERKNLFLEENENNINLFIPGGDNLTSSLNKQRKIINISFSNKNEVETLLNIYLKGFNFDLIILSDNSRSTIYEKISNVLLYN